MMLSGNGSVSLFRSNALLGMHPVLRLVRRSRPDAHDHSAVRRGCLDRAAAGETRGGGCEAATRRGAYDVRLAHHPPGTAMNPAAAVRGPKRVVKTGKTPVLDAGRRCSMPASGAG